MDVLTYYQYRPDYSIEQLERPHFAVVKILDYLKKELMRLVLYGITIYAMGAGVRVDTILRMRKLKQLGTGG